MAARTSGDADPAVRAYAALVCLYPRGHRREYGPLMVQLFRDQVRDARGGRGQGLMRLYLRTVADLIGSVVREYGRSVGIGEPFGGWSYPRAPWWQALLAALPGLLLIAGDLRLFRLLFPRAPYPHPAAMSLLAVVGCLAIVAFALLRERRLSEWAFTAVGVLLIHGPYGIALLWREGAGAVWSAMGVPSILLLFGSMVGLATVVRHRIGSAELPKWAWIVLGLSLLVLGAHAIHEASFTHPWRWETVFMVLWRWAFSTMLLVAPLLCAAIIAPSRGTRAVLLVLPVVVWWSVGTVLEPGYGLGVHADQRIAALAVDRLPAVVLLVFVPVALLRVRTAAYQAMALLLACMGTLLAIEWLRAGALPAYDEGALLVYRSGLALQLAVSLAFVVALYDALARATQMDWVV